MQHWFVRDCVGYGSHLKGLRFPLQICQYIENHIGGYRTLSQYRLSKTGEGCVECAQAYDIARSPLEDGHVMFVTAMRTVPLPTVGRLETHGYAMQNGKTHSSESASTAYQQHCSELVLLT
eukprot:3950413-Amphidinium_carterae.1